MITASMIERHTYVWEFRVEPGCEAEFEQHYGPNGTWARLFAQATGYIETLLLKDGGTADRYLTVDRWVDEAAYRAFRSAHLREYDQLDQQCAKLTTAETLIGLFAERGG
jgi:heme-degrading monooxygenase HmoA